jgi:hypothetical protein
MNKFVKVENQRDLVRDKTTGAIVNINNDELEKARARKKARQQKDFEIQELKNDVAQIKDMLSKIAEKL